MPSPQPRVASPASTDLDSGFIENLTFDELLPGQRAEVRRTLTMDDIKAFALVSGDVNPAHVDVAYADASRFHGVIAHGMWAGALISSVLGTEFPGPGTIYRSQSLAFHHPVRVGDTLLAVLTVREKNPQNRDVWLDCRVSNQHGEDVVTGEALVRAPGSKVRRPRAVLPTMHLFDPDARLEAWVAGLAPRPAVRCAVVHPCDPAALAGALDAAARGLIEPLLVAPRARLLALAASIGRSLEGLVLVDTPHSHASATEAVALARRGEVQMLMKGSLSTDELLAALQAEPALRTARRLSHVARFEVPAYGKPLLVTDAVVHIAPTLEDKADIVRNAIGLAEALGVGEPWVALLSAREMVTPHLGSTLDAAALCKMADRGQIRGARLDGPLSFDSAVSADAARAKGLVSPVAGRADILVVPDLEAGHMLVRQLAHLAGASGCGVLLGARVPVALADRGDSVAVRVAAAALAGLAAAPAASGH